MSNREINLLTKPFVVLIGMILLNLFNPLVFSQESETKTKTKTKTLSITENINSELLGQHLDYWIDTSKTAEISEVLSLKEQGWTKEYYLTPNRGITADAIWFRLKTENTNNNHIPVLLTFGYSSIDSIKMYIFDSNQTSQLIELGDKLNFNSRPYPNRNFVVPIDYLPLSSKIIYFRVNTSGSFQLPIRINSLNSFNLNEQSLLIMQSIYFGMLIIMILYNSAIYFSVKESIFIYYSLTIFSFFIFQFSLSGMAFQYLWPNLPSLNNFIIPTSVFLFSGFSCSLIITFFNLKINNLNGYQLLNTFKIICFILAAASIFTPYRIALITNAVINLPLSLSAILISLKMLKQGFSFARYFLFSWIAFILSISIFLLNKLSFIPINFFTEHSVEIGNITMIVFMSMALADKINTHKNERFIALEKTREEQRKNEQLQLDLKEEELNSRGEILKAKAESKAKSNFLAVMSHEIRTPMNGVIGIAELLKHTKLDTQQSEYVHIIESSGKNLLSIINDILDYSKIAANKMTLESIEVNLKQLINESITIFDLSAKEKNIELLIEYSEKLPNMIVTDPNRLRQIINNLLGNAIKFTDSGKIILNVSHYHQENNLSNKIIFKITDTGIGIDKNKTNKLFRSFSQVDRSMTRKFGGTGLGLSICRKIVKLMGGEIGVESVIQQGSTFWFTISPAEVTQKTLNHQEHLVNSIDLSGLNILIAEDNKTNQIVISKMLEKLNAKFTIAENGHEVFEIYQQQPESFRLILMDCEMPEQDGYQATKIIRQWELKHHLKAIPIIAVTAHAQKEFETKSIKSGMNGYLTKPIKIKSLHQEISKWISKQMNESIL